MRTALVVLMLALLSLAVAKSKTRFTRYRSWNSRMYPVWRDGDSRYRDCWKGGEVTFEVKNDAPTLTGAKATFKIDVRFPQNQTVLPDGQVVWAKNCTVNGTQYLQGQAVYQDRSTPDERTGVFPDGTPFTRVSGKKQRYIFVWKTWGRYWQVVDGPSSSLTIGTDNIPLGSYNMEVVIYHCRGKDRFIPLGYASSMFAITDQIPFQVTLSQVNDVNQADQSFIQNRAVAFSISLHDPSQYLSSSDVTFTWDFGDNSGTLISQETTVTHTYLNTGGFRPQVVLMAAIPNGCNPTPTTGGATAEPPLPTVEETTTGSPFVVDTSNVPAEVVVASTPGPADTTVDVPSSEVAPTDDIVIAVSPEPVPTAEGEVAASVTAGPVEDTATATEDETEAEAIPEEGVTVAPVVPAAEDPAAADADAAATDVTVDVAAPAEEAEVAAEEPAVVVAATAVAPATGGEEATIDLADAALPEDPAPDAEVPAAEDAAIADAPAATEVAQVETAAPADDVVITPVATDAAVVVVASAVPAVEDEAVETVNEVAADEIAVNEAVANEADENEVTAVNEIGTEVDAAAGTEAAQVALVVAKRQAPEAADGGCTIYRYGSFSTNINIVQGIESVEITEMNTVVILATEVEQNAVDLTITCQGSLPNEVCTVISDADCATPMQTVCNDVPPASECQMILRQFFNDSGVFCINVSLTNDVSLAMASARVSVTVGSSSSTGGTIAAVLGVIVLACAVGVIALTYRHFKQYHPLREDSAGSNVGVSGRTSVPLLLWNLLSRQSAGESRPLLQGRVV